MRANQGKRYDHVCAVTHTSFMGQWFDKLICRGSPSKLESLQRIWHGGKCSKEELSEQTPRWRRLERRLTALSDVTQ